ncbi:MAG: substrate-binding periplasmic protein [Alphaproteobacteria bacterium]
MRTFLTILTSVCITLFAVSFFPVKNAPTEHHAVFQKVLKSGTLRCGYAAWEPMFVIDSNTGKLSGISYDIIEKVGEKLGLKIEWVEETSWADYPQALAAGRFDAFCVAGWPNTPRARVIQFTKPVVYSSINVYAKADDNRFDADIKILNDPAYKIVFIDGTTPQIITKEAFPAAEPYALPALTPYAEWFLNIYMGKADALVADSATANHFIKFNPGKIRLVPSGKELRVFPNVFSVAMGEYDLQQALDTTLTELNNVGTIDAVIRKYEPFPGTYFPVARPYEPGVVQ